jgi:hypothetical protein
MKSWNRFLTTLVALAFILSGKTHAALPEIPNDAQKAQLWKVKRIAAIQDFQKDPAKRVPELSEMLRQLRTLGYRSSPERDDVITLLKSTLLAIPGHAKYYQDKIEAMREEVLVNSKKSAAEITKLQDDGLEIVDVWAYEAYCVNAFRTLAHIPSPECVAVLGFYLNDPVGRDGKTLLGDKRRNPGDDFDPRAINSEGAAIAIRKLGIEHPPFKLYDDGGLSRVRDQEVDAWKDWWNEVKEGKRTYRFIGSPIEYGPDGPASIEVILRAQRNMKRDEERSAGHKKATPVSDPVTVVTRISKPSSIARLVAALALISAAVWYFLRGRRAA